LDKSHDQKDDRRREADLANGRQQAKRGGGDTDADDGDDHRALPAKAIGVGAEQRGSDWAHEEGDGEGRVHGGERQGDDRRGEEQSADHRCNVKQNEQVKQIERPAQA
jgi:hypothetical protein